MKRTFKSLNKAKQICTYNNKRVCEICKVFFFVIIFPMHVLTVCHFVMYVVTKLFSEDFTLTHHINEKDEDRSVR